jgi:hypothetical protein
MPIALPIIGTVLEAGLKILDKVIPDPQAKAAAQLEMLKLQQSGEFKQIEADLQLALGQIDVNKTEASMGTFRGGWRPFIGWVCGAALGYQFLVRPLLTWLSPTLGLPMGAPELDMGDLLTLLAGMLGLGGLRTFEKVSGVSK